MCIKSQTKNFAKLLLIGAVLFIVCSTASSYAAKCVSAKNTPSCQADSANSMFAQAGRQTYVESPDYLSMGSGCVKAAVPPVAVTPKVMGAIVGDSSSYDYSDSSQKSITEYETEENDTLASIAAKFSVSIDTIAWANNLTKDAKLKAGQRLIVSPVSGIIHYVVAGDTMSKIADKYQSKSENIVAFNELSGENDIFIGDVIIVPDGKMPKAPAPQKKPSPASSPVTNNFAQNNVSVPGSYFLCPIGSVCRRTQGAHFRSAVDLSTGACGTPIYAAASGTIAKAKYGWNGGAGNNISISHMGGTIITHYYHLQTINVVAGQAVKKGDVIGTLGTTGKSTGCHLHFEVIGAANPF